MIITQTPLRIGLLGGGTDLPDYYREHGGRVLNCAIDKYIYVIVKQRFDNDIYVNYSKKEIVSRVEDLEHELVREAMWMTGVTNGVEITTLADIPSAGGSGLGSSSAVTVGLLHALFAYRGRQVTAEELADRACTIEIDRCGKPIGKQDQYIAAYGGIRDIRFGPGDQVMAEELELSLAGRRDLQRNIMLFYTGVTRSANSILAEQTANIKATRDQLDLLRDLAGLAADRLRCGDVDAVGDAMRKGWEAKRQLATGISNAQMDMAVERALEAGATGAKLTGAGGGGFLLVICPTERQRAVRESLADMHELPVPSIASARASFSTSNATSGADRRMAAEADANARTPEPEMPRSWTAVLRRLRSHAVRRMGWGLADQVMSSLSNFAVSIYVVHVLGAVQFGAFSLAFVTYGFVLNASRGLATDPADGQVQRNGPPDLAACRGRLYRDRCACRPGRRRLRARGGLGAQRRGRGRLSGPGTDAARTAVAGQLAIFVLRAWARQPGIHQRHHMGVDADSRSGGDACDRSRGRVLVRFCVGYHGEYRRGRRAMAGAGRSQTGWRMEMGGRSTVISAPVTSRRVPRKAPRPRSVPTASAWPGPSRSRLCAGRRHADGPYDDPVPRDGSGCHSRSRPGTAPLATASAAVLPGPHRWT